MITKKEMREAAHEKSLRGALIEHYLLYTDDSQNDFCLKTIGSTTYKPNKYNNIYSETKDIDKIYENGFFSEYYTDINVNRICKSEVNIYPYSHRTLPVSNLYREYNRKKLISTQTQESYASCLILGISVELETEPAVDKERYEVVNKYSYDAHVAIPEEDIENELHLYIINCVDVSMPIIIITKNKDLPILDVVFKGNIYSDTYNSYFHTYTKTVEKKLTYEKLVYGEPYNGCMDLEFEEELIGERDRYFTNDGLNAYKDEKNVSIFFDDYKIIEYNTEIMEDMNEILFVKDMNNINIFSPHYEISEKITIGNLIDIHPEVKDILYILPNEEGDILEKISLSDLEDIEYEEVYRMVWCNEENEVKFVIAIDKEKYQVYVNIDNTKEMYFIKNKNNHLFDIGINTSESDSICTYSRTNNRVINFSRDATLITFKPNYWVNMDHAGNIISTNLPLDKITEYNIYGIPKEF